MKGTVMTILSVLSKGQIHWGFMWETRNCTMTKLEMSNWWVMLNEVTDKKDK